MLFLDDLSRWWCSRPGVTSYAKSQSLRPVILSDFDRPWLKHWRLHPTLSSDITWRVRVTQTIFMSVLTQERSVPPKPMFWCQVGYLNPLRYRHWSLGQIIATVIAGTVQLGVQAWMFTNIPWVSWCAVQLLTDTILAICAPLRRRTGSRNPFHIHESMLISVLQIHLPKYRSLWNGQHHCE